MPNPPHFQLDALREMVNTGLGRAASSLNMMLDSPIELDIPSIALFRPNDLEDCRTKLGDSLLSCVQIGFNGPFAGTALLAFPPPSAAKLVAALAGDPTPPSALNAVTAETLNEVGNILINCIIGTIGNILDRPFEFSLPNHLEGRLEELLRPKPPLPGLTILLVLTRFQTRQLNIEGNIFLLFELAAIEALLSSLDSLHRH